MLEVQVLLGPVNPTSERLIRRTHNTGKQQGEMMVVLCGSTESGTDHE